MEYCIATIRVHSVTGMTEPRPSQSPRVVPFGGAVEVARSYLAIHVRNPWTGRCRSCGDAYPCMERQEAEAVIGATQPPPRRRLAVVLGLFGLVGALLAMTGVAVAAVIARW